MDSELLRELNKVLKSIPLRYDTKAVIRKQFKKMDTLQAGLLINQLQRVAKDLASILTTVKQSYKIKVEKITT